MAIQSTITLNNGTVIPQIGLGVFRTPDGDTTVNAVQTALENGYRHIDTAMIYRNETSVGEGIRRSGVPRGDLFVTTKLWNDDIRAHRGKEAFQESLDRLGMDYVDLYLIHWPADVWQQAWDDLQEIYVSGRAKAIGVSNFQPHHLAQSLFIQATHFFLGLRHPNFIPSLSPVENRYRHGCHGTKRTGIRIITVQFQTTAITVTRGNTHLRQEIGTGHVYLLPFHLHLFLQHVIIRPLFQPIRQRQHTGRYRGR